MKRRGTRDGPLDLPGVLRDELAYLGYGQPDWRDLQSFYRRAGELPLSALCLSGGGIRSATFNLGILQSLARLRLLEKFDYLSSVSGGGFVAGWLRAWIHRKPDDDVSKALAEPAELATFDPLKPEPVPLAHLRVFSNYLTPGVGLFSADTWAAAAMVIRNLILNWLVLVPALAVLILIPQTALVLSTILKECPSDPLQLARQTAAGQIVLAASLLVGMISSVVIHHFRRRREPSTRGATILLWGLAPLWLATAGLCLGALLVCPEDYPDVQVLAFCLLWCIGVPLLGWLVSLVTTRGQTSAPQWRSDLIGLALSGLIASGLLYTVVRWWLPPLKEDPRLFTILAGPILLGLYLLARSLFVAFSALGEPFGASAVTPDRDDADREWWARLSGFILLAALTWTVVSALLILGSEYTRDLNPRELIALLARSATAGGVLGIITSILGASPVTSGGNRTLSEPASRIKEVIVRLLAPITIACIILLLATLVSRAGTRLTALLFLSSWVLGWVVNVNRFSAHGLYRNRIVRAYLGASNPGRNADKFTGFDPEDNLRLHELADGKRPLSVLNATLNLVGDAEHLAWQHRRAESFSMTPLYCGSWNEGYRSSGSYGGKDGISLGTAMTISGAAANPSAGYHSSPLVAFLMTLFNVRLGCWLGNPNRAGDPVFRRSGPRHAWKPLFSDLLSLTNARHPYVNLSDGGHFDNLGVYEMVLRRCRYIVSCDAGQDPKHDFEDLGNMIRKVRIDFGISIRFDEPIRILARDSQEGPGLLCALGQIGYDEVDPDTPPGQILYIKPTLLAKGKPLPYDVYSYSRASKEFAHEPTSDQWFNEAQFESYRMLGRHLGEQLSQAQPAPADMATFFEAVRQDLARAATAATDKLPSD
jgi:hypothetical protein